MIKKTIVNKLTKNIVSVHKIYKSLIQVNINPDVYFREHKNKTIDDLLRIKYILNKYFLITIKLKTEEKIEIIFMSYQDFKNWLNGLAILMKFIK